ncbi:MAG: DHH family phosphoesterase [Candidatus Micrarchaeia archaeon]
MIKYKEENGIFYVVNNKIIDDDNEVKNAIKSIIKNYNIYNLTHQTDLDGIVSAALLLRSKIINLDKMYFGNYSEEDIERVINELKEIKGSNNCLILTDINNLDKSNFTEFLKHFREDGNKIIVLDHHPLKSNINDVAKMLDVAVIGENKFCGADLVYEYIIKNINDDIDEIFDSITNLAHLSDFYLYKGTVYEYHVEKLSEVIDYINSHSRSIDTQNRKLKDMVKNISLGAYNDTKINKIFEKYKKEEEKYMKILLSEGNLFEFKNDEGNLKIGVGFSKNLKSNNACEAIFKKTYANIALFVNIKSGSVSLRRKNECNVDLGKIASYFGGGGHAYASGFNLDKKTLNKIKTEEGKNELIDKIKEVINKIN